MNSMKDRAPRFLTLAAALLGAAMMRILPHPWNVTPVAAMALFGGAKFSDGRTAFLLPLGALLLSDMVLGFYAGMWIVYFAFALIVCIGRLIRGRQNAGALVGASLTASMTFFFVTNFFEWLLNPHNLYPKTSAGLAACFTAALPFFRNTLLGDLAYVGLLFGLFHLAERRFRALSDNERPALSSSI